MEAAGPLVQCEGDAEVSELASRIGVHPTMITQWKPALRDGVFERGSRKAPVIGQDQLRDLHAKIGELAVANSRLERTLTPWGGK